MSLLFAFLASFLWGTTYAATQYFLSGWPPLLLGALRALPAGLLLLALRPNLPKTKDIVKLSVIGSVNIGIFFICIFVMALTLPSAISSVGMMTLPVFAMLFQWILAKKRPSFWQVFSGVLLIATAIALFNPSSITLSYSGLLAMLLAVLFIILGSVLTQKIGTKIHWCSVVTWQLIAGGSLLTIATIADACLNTEKYQNVFSQLSMYNLFGLVWIIVLNTVVAYSLYVWALQRLSVVEFTFSGVANPIAGVLCGWGLLNDSYTLSQYLLMLSMVVMSLLPNMIKARKSFGLNNKGKGF